MVERILLKKIEAEVAGWDIYHFWHPELPDKDENGVYDSYVRSNMFYGSETGALASWCWLWVWKSRDTYD